jgi:hypothetical protein
MSDTARKLLGAVLAAACLAVAWFVSSQLEASERARAEEDAVAAVSAMLGPAESKLQGERETVKKIAQEGARWQACPRRCGSNCQRRSTSSTCWCCRSHSVRNCSKRTRLRSEERSAWRRGRRGSSRVRRLAPRP